jgi:deoxyribodipyrimidine photolyase-related protein
MSNYCKNCTYNVKQKTGEQACPFNYLYWHFLQTYRDKLQHNPRMSMIYRLLAKKTAEDLTNIQQSADNFIASLYDHNS